MEKQTVFLTAETLFPPLEIFSHRMTVISTLEETAPLLKCLWYKRKDKSLDSQNSHKCWSMWWLLCHSSLRVQRQSPGQDGWWDSSYQQALGLTERPYSKYKLEERGRCLTSTSGLYTTPGHMYIHTFRHTYTTLLCVSHRCQTVCILSFVPNLLWLEKPPKDDTNFVYF